mmetsp:Transcript_17047/g.54598  ORF Transcript_17047/g.54598 Transcript_17047/m.54598 type:complete len:256 (-) Transcript_17047:502-1269(-)
MHMPASPRADARANSHAAALLSAHMLPYRILTFATLATFPCSGSRGPSGQWHLPCTGSTGRTARSGDASSRDDSRGPSGQRWGVAAPCTDSAGGADGTSAKALFSAATAGGRAASGALPSELAGLSRGLPSGLGVRVGLDLADHGAGASVDWMQGKSSLHTKSPFAVLLFWGGVLQEGVVSLQTASPFAVLLGGGGVLQERGVSSQSRGPSAVALGGCGALQGGVHSGRLESSIAPDTLGESVGALDTALGKGES